MGKRGPSSFKKLDAERAIRSARAAGLEPSMVEIEMPGGSIIRVFGDRAAAATAKEIQGIAEWDAETEKLKLKKAKKERER
jgi:hypothetical protein